MAQLIVPVLLNLSHTTCTLKKYLEVENQGKWKYFFDLELERHGGSIALASNLNKKDTIENLKIKNCFIKETLLSWAEVNFDEHMMSEKQFLEQILWNNSLVKLITALSSIKNGLTGASGK